MKIALAHYRVGDTDGVSLEMEKWKSILEKLGHEVVLLAGNSWNSDTLVIEELNYRNPYNYKIVYNSFENLADYRDEQSLMDDIFSLAAIIEDKLIYLIDKESIDLLIVNNIFSIGWGLSAAIAFNNAIKKTKIPAISHHHVFYWEREKYSFPTCSSVKEIMDKYFPPKDKNIYHIVLNKIAQKELLERRGILADIVPNVFDFNAKPWTIDQYNYDFRESIGIKKDEILVLQTTRVQEIKAIELGMDVIYEMQKEKNLNKIVQKGLYNGTKLSKHPKIIYVLAGEPETSFDYIYFLKQKAKKLGIDLRFVNDVIGSMRNIINDKKIYSLWDAYVHADLIMYPSILEGWGSQLLEAVFARKPTIIYEYPVYLSDIKDKNFSFISLGCTHTIGKNNDVIVEKNIIKNVAQEAIEILTDSKLYRNVTEHNMHIGKRYYSLESLEDYLQEILKKALLK